jgi:hypothetical protein
MASFQSQSESQPSESSSHTEEVAAASLLLRWPGWTRTIPSTSSRGSAGSTVMMMFLDIGLLVGMLALLLA